MFSTIFQRNNLTYPETACKSDPFARSIATSFTRSSERNARSLQYFSAFYVETRHIIYGTTSGEGDLGEHSSMSSGGRANLLIGWRGKASMTLLINPLPIFQVTGCSSGLGYALATVLHAQGYR